MRPLNPAKGSSRTWHKSYQLSSSITCVPGVRGLQLCCTSYDGTPDIAALILRAPKGLAFLGNLKLPWIPEHRVRERCPVTSLSRPCMNIAMGTTTTRHPDGPNLVPALRLSFLPTRATQSYTLSRGFHVYSLDIGPRISYDASSDSAAISDPLDGPTENADDEESMDSGEEQLEGLS
jgi:hypothetical protein